METLKEEVENKLKEKGRRKVKRVDKVKNQILRELYNNRLEKGEGLNINELKNLIPESHYGDVHRAVDDLEFFSNAVISEIKKDGNITKRIVKLDPSWTTAIKKNYELNNGNVTTMLIIDYRVSFLEHKRYIEFLLSHYRLDTKIEFKLYDNVEDLKNNNRLSELKPLDMELMQRYMAENMSGFTIESLKGYLKKYVELLRKFSKKNIISDCVH